MGARSLCNMCFVVERSHKLVSSRDCIRQVSSRMGCWNAVGECHKGGGAVPLQACHSGRFDHYHIFVWNPDFKVVILIYLERKSCLVPFPVLPARKKFPVKFSFEKSPS